MNAQGINTRGKNQNQTPMHRTANENFVFRWAMVFTPHCTEPWMFYWGFTRLHISHSEICQDFCHIPTGISDFRIRRKLGANTICIWFAIIGGQKKISHVQFKDLLRFCSFLKITQKNNSRMLMYYILKPTLVFQYYWERANDSTWLKQ